MGDLIKRGIDVLLSGLVLLLLFPLIVIVALVLKATRGRVFNADQCIDRNGKLFPFLRFDILPAEDAGNQGIDRLLANFSLYRLPAMMNILFGDISFVGPTLAPADDGGKPPAYIERNIRPGLTGLYQLRSSANIAHELAQEADLEYMDSHSIKGDIGILLRSLLMLFLGKSAQQGEAPEKICLLDISINNLSMDEALDWIMHSSGNENGVQMAFVNPDCMNISCVNPDYKSLLQRIDRVFGDGIGIHVATRMLDLTMADNVNGTDLFPFLCERAEKEQVPLYFLGGKPGITDAMVEVLEKRYPELRVAGHHHGYFSADEEADVIEKIRDSGARILLVAFGAPRQEMWIDANLGELGVGVAMGVGGLFDFASGRMKRAPRWMREIGMEWVYRLLQEPGRMWRRYIIGNPLFLWRVRQWKRNRERK